MKEQDIDKLFKDKLANHKQMPPLQTWDKINAKLNQKKRRAVVLWRMAAGVALVAGASLLSYSIFTSKIDNANGIAISKNDTKNSKNNIETNENNIQLEHKNNNLSIESNQKVNKTNYVDEITKNKTKNVTISNKVITNIVITNSENNIIKSNIENSISKLTAIDSMKNMANTVIDLPKISTNVSPNTNLDSSKFAANSENVIEVIVKLDSRMTKLAMTDLDSNANQNSEVLAGNQPKKRTLFGKIWQKVKEGETVTLQDVGVTAEKLPKFLRRN